MASRAKKVALGCGLGCVGLVIVGVSSCIGFQVWLNTPGELLEANVLLDPEAVGWAEARLDLEDEGTEALASTLLELARPPEGMFETSPFLAVLTEINSRRQQRQMRRLFPATAVWSLYPGEPGGREPILLSASVPRMAHTLALIDWGIGLVARRQPELVTELYRGERILVIDEPAAEAEITVEAGGLRIETERDLGDAERDLGDGERDLGDGDVEADWARLDPDEPFTAHIFLRDVGVFFATSVEVAHRAIDGLEGGPAQASGSPLERLVAGLPEAPIRAALLNDDAGRLARVLGRLLPDVVLDDDTREVLDRARSATLVGRFGAEGELELTLTLAGVASDDSTLSVLEAAAARMLDSEDDLGGTATVEPAAQGVVVSISLLLAEAAERAIEERRVIVR